jgi:hypothetical protein
LGVEPIVSGAEEFSSIAGEIVWKVGEISRGFREITRDFGEISRSFREITRSFREITRGFGEISRGFGEITRSFGEIVPGVGKIWFSPSSLPRFTLPPAPCSLPPALGVTFDYQGYVIFFKARNRAESNFEIRNKSKIVKHKCSKFKTKAA